MQWKPSKHGFSHALVLDLFIRDPLHSHAAGEASEELTVDWLGLNSRIGKAWPH